MDDEVLIRAKATAKERYGGIEGITGWGIGDGSVRVYVHNAGVKRLLPADIDGVPFEFVITGDIVALGE